MIARALAQEPVLLVLDEPTAFLDVPSRVELMGLLRQLTRDGRWPSSSRRTISSWRCERPMSSGW